MVFAELAETLHTLVVWIDTVNVIDFVKNAKGEDQFLAALLFQNHCSSCTCCFSILLKQS